MSTIEQARHTPGILSVHINEDRTNAIPAMITIVAEERFCFLLLFPFYSPLVALLVSSSASSYLLFRVLMLLAGSEVHLNL